MPGEISKYLYTDEEMRPLYSRIAKSFNYAEVNITLWYTLCLDIEHNADDLDVHYLHAFVTVPVSIKLNLGYTSTHFHTLAI